MLTGDNHASAEALARELGIDETHAELLPHDKVAVVQHARSSTGRSRWWAMASTTRRRWPPPTSGIAMGAAGTDAALETADIALMADELLKIPFAIRLGRATLAQHSDERRRCRSVSKAVFLALAVVGFRHVVDGGGGRHGRVAAGDREWHEVAAGGLKEPGCSAAAAVI